MGLDRLHLGEAERELALAAESASGPSSSMPRIGTSMQAEAVGVALAEAVEGQRADDGLLDGVVGQDAADQLGRASAGPSTR